MNARLSRWLLYAIIISSIGCTKELSDEQPVPPRAGEFYATINGSLWNADSIQQVLVGSNGVGIGGLARDGQEITMILPEFKTGTYTLNAVSPGYAMYGNIFGSLSSLYYSSLGTAGGTVTISSIDSLNHLVSGSFTFNLFSPTDNAIKAVTGGVFDYIPYIEDPSAVFPPSNVGGSDTLNALIDGVAFTSGIVQVVTNNGQLTIAGIASNGPQDISLIMPSNISPGTYNLDFGSGVYVGIYNPSPNVNFYSLQNGQLTVVSNDPVAKKIAGSFQFTASPISSGTPVEITEGYFVVNYQ